MFLFYTARELVRVLVLIVTRLCVLAYVLREKDCTDADFLVDVLKKPALLCRTCVVANTILGDNMCESALQ